MEDRGPDDRHDGPSDSVVIEFLGVLLADRLTGAERPLAEYLAMYPGQEETVATAFRRSTVGPAANGDPPAHGPETVGPYRLVRELGRGGQGSVWLARDERLGRAVALKLVRRSPLLADQAPRFRREAQAASRLDHPGLCAVYDIGVDGAVAWIAMRHVEGETLAQRLARASADGPAPARDVDATLLLVERVARAVHVAHEAGIVHRDLKPGNIMITPDGSPVVLDFGVARQEDDGPLLTLTGEALGTPAYMPPEALRGEHRPLDRRADVWSLGVTLHEALVGRRPFEAPTREALVRAILDSEPPDPRARHRGIGRDLAVVLQTALAKDLDRRYRTALDLAEDLRNVREHKPVNARPVGPMVRLLQWRRRNRALAASLLLLLLVLAGGLGVTSGLLADTRRTLEQKQQLLGEFTQLSDQKLAEDLLAEEAALWPAVPERAPDMEGWLAAANELLERRPHHETSLAAANARLAQVSQGGVAAAGAGASTSDAWLHGQLTELLDDLTSLAAAQEKVAARLQFARDVERRTLVEPAAAWTRAAAELAADPRFAGVKLVPQRGLVPLGADPDSHLEEFALLQSGEPPARDPSSGRLRRDEGSGIVLVLLPGATTQVGCVVPDAEHPAGAPHVDPHAGRYDGPVQTVTLDPFFMGKFEVTQGQWLRHTGTNPATYVGGGSFAGDGTPLLHPVETVSWVEADRVMSELGLALPTDAQWEYADRAGTATTWWTGEDPRSLQGACNIADHYAHTHGGHESWSYEDGLDDGYTAHAPVGSYRGNAFGLHDTVGNVMEWCRDTWEDWSLVHPRDGDGYCHESETAAVIRGSNYSTGSDKARSGARDGLPKEARTYSLGLRPARALER